MKPIKIFLIFLVLFISISAVSAEGNFTALQNEISTTTLSNIDITQDYVYDEDMDEDIDKGIVIDKTNFTINGNGHTIDGNNKVRVFKIIGDNITILNLNIINGYIDDDNGGGIYTGSALVLNNVSFTNNFAKTGGAISGDEAMEINSCTFNNNSANSTGGCIYSEENLTVSNSVFTNSYALIASAIRCLEVTSITDSVFMNLTSDDYGAIYTTNPTEIANCAFFNNTANWGASIYSNNTISINNTTFTNSKSKYAAAIYAEGNISIMDSIFLNLDSNETAGAIGLRNLNYGEINNCTFLNTTSNKNGGAVFIDVKDTDTTKRETYIINPIMFFSNSVNVLQIASLERSFEHTASKAFLVNFSSFSSNRLGYDVVELFLFNLPIIARRMVTLP